MALSDIETIVIVIMENRSFDHLCGYLSLASTPAPLAVEGLSDDAAWRAPLANMFGGEAYPLHRLAPAAQQIDDPDHTQKSIAVQIDTPPAGGPPGQMGGFVQSYVTYAPTGKPPHDRSLVMGYYDAAAAPVVDFFARKFAICDHWFASLPLGTQANRLMAMGGESLIVDNAALLLPDQDLVYDWLTRNKVSWCAYQSGDFLPFFTLMPDWTSEIATSLAASAVAGLRGHFRRFSRFAAEWADNGSPMPSVIFIEPEYTDGPHFDPNDDHPPTGMAKGQVFLADIYAALIANPARWQNTLMLVTYDEHGGFFDHVPPLPIPGNAGGTSFLTTGVRVPALVVSPHVAPGTVHSGALDHTSILQFLADRFAPGQDYSPAVAARQQHLTRLSEILADAPIPRAPEIDAIPLAATRAVAAAAPVPPPNGALPGDPPNAQALHNVAVKIANDHPDLVAAPGWERLADYVNRFV
ncbi:MAG TPA: alkaline phosphatase family protein [Stellaceae bacterium]|nr:alkaline phosphatase family protein [Stellaceae bacterium]